MKRSTEGRILATRVGSLPRPNDLDDAVEQSGEDPNAYAEVMRRSVADVVRKQVEVGVDVVDASRRMIHRPSSECSPMGLPSV